jgi:aspartyl aminopeptidase
MPSANLAADLCRFIDASPTPYHAVQQMVDRLEKAGFVSLQETDTWQLKEQTGYIVTRNDSSVIAFTTGDAAALDSGIAMVGAHTDSPCLKVKPNAGISKQGVSQLGVEVYGGALLNPWFDRDLSLAGRVTYEDKDGQLQNALVDFKKPIARIPSLAIHLDIDANKNRSVNAQKHLPLVLAQDKEGDKQDFKELLAAEMPVDNLARIFAYEIYAYDTQSAAVTGLDDDYVSAARLDNLLSCFCGLTALIEAFRSNPEKAQLLVCTDHEEIGSQSACGAQGPFLKDTLERLLPDNEKRQQAIRKSLLISADNAHAVHPNYADRHDEDHGPKINAGPVIKISANQRYATNSENSAVFRQICDQESIPVQEFVVRSDMGCGSTIGPITASTIGVSTVDVGCPQWAMHSIRETAGSQDISHMTQAMTAFYQRPVATVK